MPGNVSFNAPATVPAQNPGGAGNPLSGVHFNNPSGPPGPVMTMPTGTDPGWMQTPMATLFHIYPDGSPIPQNDWQQPNGVPNINNIHGGPPGGLPQVINTSGNPSATPTPTPTINNPTGVPNVSGPMTAQQGSTPQEGQLGIANSGGYNYQQNADFKEFLSRLEKLFPGMNAQGGQQNAGQTPNFNQTQPQPVYSGVWEGGTGLNRATTGRVV